MARIIVFHFTEQGRVPKLSREELTGLRTQFLDVLKGYPDVHFNGMFIDENGMGICDWEAPNPDVVKEVVQQATGFPPPDPTIKVSQVLL